MDYDVTLHLRIRAADSVQLVTDAMGAFVFTGADGDDSHFVSNPVDALAMLLSVGVQKAVDDTASVELVGGVRPVIQPARET